jgi:hypothetical protein
MIKVKTVHRKIMFTITLFLQRILSEKKIVSSSGIYLAHGQFYTHTTYFRLYIYRFLKWKAVFVQPLTFYGFCHTRCVLLNNICPSTTADIHDTSTSYAGQCL